LKRKIAFDSAVLSMFACGFTFEPTYQVSAAPLGPLRSEFSVGAVEAPVLLFRR
jgi:hypothetical protein